MSWSYVAVWFLGEITVEVYPPKERGTHFRRNFDALEDLGFHYWPGAAGVVGGERGRRSYFVHTIYGTDSKKMARSMLDLMDKLEALDIVCKGDSGSVARHAAITQMLGGMP